MRWSARPTSARSRQAISRLDDPEHLRARSGYERAIRSGAETERSTSSRADRDLVRVSGALHSDPTPRWLVILTLTVVALAIAKPWAVGDQAGASTGPAPRSPASAAATELASLYPSSPPADQACYPVTAWRLYTVEDDGSRTILTWYSLTPLSGAGAGSAGRPFDPKIPVVDVFARRLLSVGFCPPIGGGRRPVVSTQAWQVSAGNQEGSALRLVPAAHFAPDPSDGQLFGPPPALLTAGPVAWPPGHYVFDVRVGPSTADEDWFAVQVESVGQQEPGSVSGSAARSNPP